MTISPKKFDTAAGPRWFLVEKNATPASDATPYLTRDAARKALLDSKVAAFVEHCGGVERVRSILAAHVPTYIVPRSPALRRLNAWLLGATYA